MQKTQTQRRFRRLAGATAAVALLATGAISAHTFASGDRAEDGAQPLPPPGNPVVLDGPDNNVFEEAGDNTLITTGSTAFDDSILTKFIPASAFDPYQGGLGEADLYVANGDGCISPIAATAGSGSLLQMFAPVELPDGSRIKKVTFFGTDNSADAISVYLRRENFSSSGFVIFPATPTYTRTGLVVDSFATVGANATTVLSGNDNLNEIAGSFSTGLLNFSNRFHSVEVRMSNAAGLNHVLCGVQVQYQVAKSTADAGTVFHPVAPYRAFDSRLATFGGTKIAPNTTKDVDISDGYDLVGVAIPAQANLVPANATAITYNITVTGTTGPNFISVTAGGAATYTTSAINFAAGSNLANGSTVTVDATQKIRLHGGNQSGSAHVIIDVTGYYAPAPAPSNMGN